LSSATHSPGCKRNLNNSSTIAETVEVENPFPLKAGAV
jgi:hypothetical protein